MAFPEGSPTHPSYGAGDATVAGAILNKAWFDHGRPLVHAGNAIAFEPNARQQPGRCLRLAVSAAVEGSSTRWPRTSLGEQVALGLLEDQKRTYVEIFTLTVPHDGTSVQI